MAPCAASTSNRPASLSGFSMARTVGTRKSWRARCATSAFTAGLGVIARTVPHSSVPAARSVAASSASPWTMSRPSARAAATLLAFRSSRRTGRPAASCRAMRRASAPPPTTKTGFVLSSARTSSPRRSSQPTPHLSSTGTEAVVKIAMNTRIEKISGPMMPSSRPMPAMMISTAPRPFMPKPTTRPSRQP
jgi:hypothetical protein